jgi:glycosyltransferase involved in cell wall biosynthesis
LPESFFSAHKKVGHDGPAEYIFLSMNILVLNWRDMKHPQAGGAEVHFQELFKRFVKNGHTVVLLTTRYPGSEAQDTQDGIILYRLGHTYLFNVQAPFLVRHLCRKHAIDCIVDDVNKIPFFTPRWFPAASCGVIFHHLFGRTVFGLTAFPLAAYVWLLERTCAWGYKNTPVCTVSQSTARELVERGFPWASITIIENSVDTDLYCPDPGIAKEDNLLLFTGRLKKYKNVRLVISAVKKLSMAGRRVRFVVAGSGDDEQDLKGYARQLSIGGLVEFLGHIDEATKIRLYRRCTLFVNPSIKEGWGITNIEAGACGTAVVANDVPGLRDSVKNGETGLLYRENDLDDCVRCIAELLDRQEIRRRYETEGRRWAMSFSWDQSFRKMEQWLNGVVCAQKRRR